jgi:hypothetical protein
LTGESAQIFTSVLSSLVYFKKVHAQSKFKIQGELHNI